MRLVELVTGHQNREKVEQIISDIKKQANVDYSVQVLESGQLNFRILLESEYTERMLNTVSNRFYPDSTYRLCVLPVEATLPRVEETASTLENKESGKKSRLSLEEIYSTVRSGSRLDVNFLALSVLSAVVAAVGLMSNSVAAVIGAMVIAPFLGPSVGLSLASTLGDAKLARRSLLTLGAGFGLCLLLAVGIGRFFPVDPSISEIASRTKVGLTSLVLAIASGVAGALSYTLGFSFSMVGVMVAVALVPPLVTGGLLLGAGHINLALGAFALCAVNVISLNLSGVITFLIRGLRPTSWWEKKKAWRMTLTSLLLWAGLLGALLLLVYNTSLYVP